MGFPITTYTVLNSIASGRREPYFQDLIAPFNLFAFILGNPKRDQKLFETIESGFDRLAYVTGERFLFFAIAKPSNWRWRRSRIDIDKFSKFQPLSVGPDHEGALANALALSLGIPQSALPCIVVTSDLGSKDLFWLSTSADTIEKQLTTLGYLSSQHHRHEIMDALRAEPIGRDDETQRSSASLDTSIANVIADVLSFPLVHERGFDAQSARQRATEALGAISNTLRQQKEQYHAPLEDEPDRSLLDNLASNSFKRLACLSLLSRSPDTSLWSTAEPTALFARELSVELEPERRERKISPDPLVKYQEEVTNLKRRAPQFSFVCHHLRRLGEQLESESVLMLKTALIVQELLERRPNILGGLLEHEIDYTSTVICLAKVFEREVNFSLVHWVRDHLGISLPAYFNKYEPEKRALFSPNLPSPRDVDFNRQREGDWIPPGLGESLICCRSLGRNHHPNGWSRTSWRRLIAGWYVIKAERNKAAHTAFIDKQAALRVSKTLDKLAGQEVFDSMCALKTKYRGF